MCKSRGVPRALGAVSPVSQHAEEIANYTRDDDDEIKNRDAMVICKVNSDVSVLLCQGRTCITHSAALAYDLIQHDREGGTDTVSFSSGAEQERRSSHRLAMVLCLSAMYAHSAMEHSKSMIWRQSRKVKRVWRSFRNHRG